MINTVKMIIIRFLKNISQIVIVYRNQNYRIVHGTKNIMIVNSQILKQVIISPYSW